MNVGVQAFPITKWAIPVATYEERQRILACVNAMKGVKDPEAFVAAVKSIIHKYRHLPILVPCDPHEIAKTLAGFIDMELPT